MPVDPLGLTILVVGLALLVVELAKPGYYVGVVATTGIVVGLVQITWPDLLLGRAYGPFVVAAIALVALAGSLQFYRRFAPPLPPPLTVPPGAVVGREGRVVRAIEHDSLRGRVRIDGLVWSATSDGPIPEGETVRVTELEDSHLRVRPEPRPTHAWSEVDPA